MTANKRHEERPVILIGAAATAIFFLLAVGTFGAINDMEAQAQEEGRGSNIITITGTNSGENVEIREDVHESEICTNARTVVRGSGVTYLGQVPSCPSNLEYGWDISPNPDGVNTRYRLDGNGVLGGGSNVDGIEVDEGRGTDNDVFSLDADQFLLFDGPGNDRYDLTGDAPIGSESIIYSDTTGGSGRDRVTFTER